MGNDGCCCENCGGVDGLAFRYLLAIGSCIFFVMDVVVSNLSGLVFASQSNLVSAANSG